MSVVIGASIRPLQSLNRIWNQVGLCVAKGKRNWMSGKVLVREIFIRKTESGNLRWTDSSAKNHSQKRKSESVQRRLMRVDISIYASADVHSRVCACRWRCILWNWEPKRNRRYSSLSTNKGAERLATYQLILREYQYHMQKWVQFGQRLANGDK